MERSRLKAKRKMLGFSQEVFAEKCGVSVSMVQRWEAGTHTPQPCNLGMICGILGISDLADIDVYIGNTEEEDSLEYTRREAIEQFLLTAGIPFVMGDSGPMLTAPYIAPEEFLGQCNTALRGCWSLLDSGGFSDVEATLLASLPTLSRFAAAPSRYQRMAAGLAMQAKMLQAILAAHYHVNYAERELAAMEAVRFAEISGDLRMRVAATIEYGMSYVSRPDPSPDQAIPSFLGVQSLVDESAAPLMLCDLFVCLSNAYAINGNEVEAMKALEHAENIRSTHKPAQDLDWLYTGGFPEFHSLQGRVYLRLAPHFPEGDYFQRAYGIFASFNASSASRNSAGLTIYQADAARGMGDLDKFTELLGLGARAAAEIGSQRRIDEAITVYRSIPESWQRNPKVQQLQHSIPQLSAVMLQ